VSDRDRSIAPLPPASTPRPARELRTLVLDGSSGRSHVARSDELAGLFEPGDLVVLNDAATLPATLFARTPSGEPVEIRLMQWLEGGGWTAALLGRGDHRTRTEDRPPPPPLALGARLFVGGEIEATITGLHPESPRLVDVVLGIVGDASPLPADILAALYRLGRPVQYAHVPSPLALWDIQNVYAGRPWAMEMPSAGRAIRTETLLALRARGVGIAWVTHAAGISAVGDPAIDVMLPLPERFEVTEATWEAIARTRKRGGRVIAIGTSTARALEGGARAGTLTGITDLRIGPGMRRAIVDAILTGAHDVETSHFTLLGAFASRAFLEGALVRMSEEGFLGHELGDTFLVWGEPREKRWPRRSGGGAAARARLWC
jgi:S-adenosylmethionine:tRNA ribosyltransferase-isomerase